MSEVPTHNNRDHKAEGAFRAELLRNKLPQSAKAGAAALFLVNTAFVAVDWFAYRSAFFSFLPIRLGLNLVLSIVYLGLAYRRPQASVVITYVAGAVMLFAVIVGSGGAQSPYYVGLILLLMGGPVLVPFSARQNAALSAFVLVAFLAVPGDGAIDSAPVAVSAAFLCSAAVVGTLSAAHLHRMRFIDYLQRVEIETSRDELAELNRMKSEFTMNVHHELRTPLAIILASVELLSKGEPLARDELEGRLARIRVHALRLLRMINNLLDIAKSEARALGSQRSSVDLGELVARVVEGARPLAQRRQIQLFAPEPLSSVVVSVNPEELEQVLVNLIGNALKFTSSGGAIRVGIARRGDRVVLEISDTGCGFSPDSAGRLFDRFWQEDTSSARSFEGSGLGLALCKQIIEAHGGSIDGHSAGSGQGATFTVQLEALSAGVDMRFRGTFSGRQQITDAFDAQLHEREDAVHRPGTVGVDAEWGHASSVRRQIAGGQEARSHDLVLVADDSGDLRRLVADILSIEFDVLEARGGLEALEQVRLRQPGLIILDLMMPGTSGLDVCRAVRADPVAATTPILILTARDESEARIACLELGADDYMTKPFHPKELQARVRALCRTRALQRELSTSAIELASAAQREREVRGEVELYARAVSHDLRSPIAAAAEALRLEAEEGRSGSRWVRLASESLERANRMLLGLRNLMRTVGRPEVFSRIDIASMVAELIREFEASGRARPGEISIRGEFVDVIGQPEKLAHVFRNLISNALDHGRCGPRGTIEIWQDVHTDASAFVIADRGPGIPSEMSQRVFEPFVRGELKTDGGLGLGLTLARQIVVGHGGSIEVRLREGGGTLARFSLPRRDRPTSH